MKRILALALGLVMVIALFAACAPTPTTDDPPYNGYTQPTEPAPQWQRHPDLAFDELVMATNAEFPPFEFMEDGEFVGFDVDLAHAIAARLGLPLRIDNMAFDAIITAVQTSPGNVVGIAAMTITEERAQTINFTMPYFETELVVILPEGSDVATNEDLRGRNVAVQLGTTSDLFVTEFSDLFEEDNITRLPSPPNLILELNAGQVDAVIIDKEVALQFVDDNPGLMILDYEPIGQDNYGIAVQQGQDLLLELINNALVEMKADGEYDRIFAAWFGGGDEAYEYNDETYANDETTEHNDYEEE